VTILFIIFFLTMTARDFTPNNALKNISKVFSSLADNHRHGDMICSRSPTNACRSFRSWNWRSRFWPCSPSLRSTIVIRANRPQKPRPRVPSKRWNNCANLFVKSLICGIDKFYLKRRSGLSYKIFTLNLVSKPFMRNKENPKRL